MLRDKRKKQENMNCKIGTEMCIENFLKNFINTIAKETNV